MHPKDIVRNGYDQLATDYRQHFSELHQERYDGWNRVLSQHLVPRERVLELGCADGIPLAKSLAVSFDYTGVDLSPVQIAHARKNVPQGTFVVGDMTQVDFSPQSFAAIVALYSIIHVPIEEQRPLIGRMFGWLKEGGLVMIVVGAGRWTGTEADWIRHGTTMFWSHASGEEYAEWFCSAGFRILERYFVPEGKVGHTFMLLRKPNQTPQPTRPTGG